MAAVVAAVLLFVSAGTLGLPQASLSKDLSYERNPADYIHSPGATMWGFWGQTEACQNGSYAYGFEIKVEPEVGAFDDDTSVNAIELFCRTPQGVHTGEVTSDTMDRGTWTGAQHCAGGFINGYTLKVMQDGGGMADNTAATGLRMYCLGQDEPLEGPGNHWGDWLEPARCKAGEAVCGIMTRIQPDQGRLGDDTALNDVRFQCCDLPASYLEGHW